MFREIKIPKDYIENHMDLISYIVKIELFKYIRLNLSEEIYERYDVFLQTILNIVDFTIDDLIHLIIKNLNIYETPITGFVFEISNAAYIPNSNYKLNTICRLVTYGNDQIKGNYFIADAFDKLQKNFNKIFIKKYLGM